MSEKNDNGIRRSVTRISGDSARPLILPSKIADKAFIQPNSSKDFGKKRPLPVNPDQLSFDPKRLQVQKLKRTQKSTESSISSVDQNIPLTDEKKAITYDGILHFDQAGPAIIGSANTKDCTLVAIKTSKRTTKVDLKFLIELSNDNVVQLLDVFDTESDEICMIYEQMEVSLRLINGNPYIKWKAYEIAAISKEVNERFTSP